MSEKFLSTREILIYFSILYQGDWKRIMQAIDHREEVDHQEAKKVLDAYPDKAITIVDEEIYPKCFLSSFQPPFVLFYRGDISLLKDGEHSVGYVGSREASPYGLSVASEFGEELAKNGYNIVSGLARGIDAAALKGAVKYHKTIAVIGNGFDTYYPPSNSSLQREIETNGLLISEYPLGVKPEAKNFPVRNRIIAALGKGLVVGEAHSRSGTSITVNYALALGKSVMCIPYPIDAHSVCNQFIREGATLVESAKDIIENLK